MRTFIRASWLAACVLVLISLIACKRFEISGEGTSGANRHLLFDFRDSLPVESASQPASARVLSAVFSNYSPQARGCKSTPEQAGKLDHGSQHPPRLLGVAQGTFTEPGTSQTAYLLDPGNCETDPSGFGEQRLAVFSGDQLAKVARVSATRLLGTFDLDQDGKREFLLAKELVGDNLSSVNAHLLGLEEQTYRVVENFGRVRYENCGSREGSITAVKLDYLPEVDPKTGATLKKMPRFAAELYRAACPRAGQQPTWVRVQGMGGK
jgi:hypothetical protein